MKLSFPERLYVNSPFRALVQRPWEFRIFTRFAPFPRHAHVLEIGCGNGGTLAYVARHFNPASLTGIDLDPLQITRARKRLDTTTVNLATGSAANIPLPAHSYDAILCLGVLHHMPEWPRAVAECARLLRHGGLLYTLEFYPPLLNLPLLRRLFPHPATSLTPDTLTETLTRYGFSQLGTSPTPSNAFKRYLGKRFNLTVSRLAITQPEYD